MSDLHTRLARFAKVRLGHFPTPLDQMPRLEEDFRQKKLWVKRDDCNGLAFGGNKVRQLEYYLGDAKRINAACILITGAVQSNFVRLAAAGANKLGMVCHIQLESRVSKDSTAYQTSGNVLVDNMLGAKIHYYADGENEEGADKNLHEIAEKLKQDGAVPYIIHLSPGHPPLGALGYVDAACEFAEQITEQHIRIDKIVVPSGSGNTHAGLLFGLRSLGINIPVAGICVRRDAGAQTSRIVGRCSELANLLEVENPVSDLDIDLTDEFLGPSYGQLNDATRSAISIAAKKESLILDPVYSGKTMAGFLKNVHSMPVGSNLLFWHTGGSPAIFGYVDDLAG